MMSKEIVSVATMNRVGRVFNNPNDTTVGGVYYGHVQGMCYANGNIVYGLTPFSGADQANCLIRKVNATTGAKVTQSVFPFYHCNSMAYDKAQNLLYVCPMINASGANVATLERINYNTFASAGSKTLRYPFAACAFDNSSNKLYTLRSDSTGLVVDVYNNSYVYQSTIKLQVPEGFGDTAISPQAGQSFEVYDGRIYVLFAYPNTINVYDMNGANVQNYTLPARSNGLYTVGECEDITAVGDGRFYIASYYIVNVTPTPVCATGLFEIDVEQNVPDVRSASIAESPTHTDAFRFFVDNGKNIFNPDGSEARPFQFVEEAMECCFSDTIPRASITLCNTSYPAILLFGVNKKVIIQPKAGIGTPTINGLYIVSCSDLELRGLRFSGAWAGYNSRIASEYSSLCLQDCTFANDSDIYTVNLYRTVLTLMNSTPNLIYAHDGSRVYKDKAYAWKPVECDATSQVYPYSRISTRDLGVMPGRVSLYGSLTGFTKIMIEYYIADRQETAEFIVPSSFSSPSGYSIHTFNMLDSGSIPTFVECNFQINSATDIQFTSTMKCTGSSWEPANAGDFFIGAIYGVC